MVEVAATEVATAVEPSGQEVASGSQRTIVSWRVENRVDSAVVVTMSTKMFRVETRSDRLMLTVVAAAASSSVEHGHVPLELTLTTPP